MDSLEWVKIIRNPGSYLVALLFLTKLLPHGAGWMLELLPL